MSNRKLRSEFFRAEHLAADEAHGTRILTAANGDSLAQNVPLLYDADGNVISTATRTGNTTKYVTHDAGGTTAGNLPIYDADGNLTDSGEVPGGGGAGGNPIVDGLAIEYDPAPSSSQSEDDEFDSSSLDAKWTVVTNTVAAVDIDTTWQSHIYLQVTGNQAYEIRQSFTPGGDFSLTCALTIPGVANFQQAGIAVHDNNATPYSGDSMYVDYLFNNGSTARLVAVNSGSHSVVTNYVLAHINKHYLHIERVGNTWTAAVSHNGLSWFIFASTTKSFTVDKLDLFVRMGGAGNHGEWGIDWIRRDWLMMP